MLIKASFTDERTILSMIFDGSGRSEIGRNSEGDELVFLEQVTHEPFSIFYCWTEGFCF